MERNIIDTLLLVFRRPYIAAAFISRSSQRKSHLQLKLSVRRCQYRPMHDVDFDGTSEQPYPMQSMVQGDPTNASTLAKAVSVPLERVHRRVLADPFLRIFNHFSHTKSYRS